MEREVLFRRFVHCLIALAPVYYLLPVDIEPLGVRRWVLLIAFFAIVSSVEAARLLMGWTFFGLRPHERSQIASFVWAAAGITVALWFFREDVATAAIIGMAFVDPLAGELRKRGRVMHVTVGVPILAYAALSVTVLHLYGLMSPLSVVVVSIIGATTAVSAERRKVRYIDDDFLMIVVPCLLMELFAF